MDPAGAADRIHAKEQAKEELGFARNNLDFEYVS